MVKIHHTTRTSLSVRTDTPNRCEKTSVEMFLNGRNRAFDTTHSRTIVISDSIKYRNNLNITKPLFDRVREGGGFCKILLGITPSVDVSTPMGDYVCPDSLSNSFQVLPFLRCYLGPILLTCSIPWGWNRLATVGRPLAFPCAWAL